MEEEIINMSKCPRCGRDLDEDEEICTSCGLELSGGNARKIIRLNDYDSRIKQTGAIFLLAMFGIWLIPFRNIKLVLAIISFFILPVLILYYIWRRKKLRIELQRDEADFEVDFSEGSG